MTPEKRETAIKWLQNEIRSLRLAPTINGCGPENWADLLEIMEICLEAVRGHGSEPLTLAQLREMDGKPVRVHNLRPEKKKFEWQNALVCKFRETAEHSFYTYRFSDYGKTWLAYAYQPAHIDREAWEPCGECERKSCDNCRYSEYLSYLEPCKSCENASKWKPMQNFCGECGRPLTPEAWAMLEKRLRG